MKGRAKEVTRCGDAYSGIEIHARGWEFGVKVVGFVGDDGKDTFDIWLTGGSDSPFPYKYLGGFKRPLQFERLL